MEEDFASDYLNILPNGNTSIGFNISPFYSGTNTPKEAINPTPQLSLQQQSLQSQSETQPPLQRPLPELFNQPLNRSGLFPELLEDPINFFRSTPTSPNLNSYPNPNLSRWNSQFLGGPAPTPNNGFQELSSIRATNEILSAPVSPRSKLQYATNLAANANSSSNTTATYLNNLYVNNLTSTLESLPPDAFGLRLPSQSNLANYTELMLSSMAAQDNLCHLDLGLTTSLLPHMNFDLQPHLDSKTSLPLIEVKDSALESIPQNSQLAKNFAKPIKPKFSNHDLHNNQTNIFPHSSSSLDPKAKMKAKSKELEQLNSLNIKSNKIPIVKITKPNHAENLKIRVSPPPQSLFSVPPSVSNFYKLDTPPLPDEPLNYEIKIMGIPEEGIKSRVETQIKLCLKINTVGNSNTSSLPWSHIRLPSNLVVGLKDKRKTPKTTIPPPEDKIINMRVSVVCASDRNKKVEVCIGCVQRERKRMSKRVSKACNTPSTTPFQSRPVSPGERQDELTHSEPESVDQEQKRIINFNTPALVEITGGDIILPSRLTCYCRHHKESVGFIVQFGLYDKTFKLIGIGETPPVMITDDHKTKAKLRLEPKHIKKAKIQKIESNGTLNEFISPLLNNLNASNYFYSSGISNERTLIPIVPALPSDLAQSFLLASQPLTQSKSSSGEISLPLSTHLQSQSQNLGANPQTQSNFKTIRPSSYPKIARIVPSSSTLHGGVEVALLGTNFKEGMTVYFGDTPSSMCTVWSPQSALCLAPASSQVGPVNVTIQLPHSENPFPSVDHYLDNRSTFTYHERSERELLELALQVVNLRSTGRVEPARQIALRLIQEQQHPMEPTNLEPATDSVDKKDNSGLHAPAPPTTPTKDN